MTNIFPPMVVKNGDGSHARIPKKSPTKETKETLLTFGTSKIRFFWMMMMMMMVMMMMMMMMMMMLYSFENIAYIYICI